MYYKQSAGVLLVQKSAATPQWVKWVHEPAGIFHCLECLQLDGCWFTWDNAPIWPHHEKCHCRLEAIDYLVVLMNASAYSDYSKFDPYLFNTTGIYPHTKENYSRSGDTQLMMQNGCRQRWSGKQEKNMLPENMSLEN